MAAELKSEFGVRAKQTFDRRVRFDVLVDAETVFSAAERKHLPKPGEVAESIRRLDRAEGGQPAD